MFGHQSNQLIIKGNNQKCRINVAFTKYPERHKLWISRVPNGWSPREDQRIFICENHLKPGDIVKVKDRNDTNKN